MLLLLILKSALGTTELDQPSVAHPMVNSPHPKNTDGEPGKTAISPALIAAVTWVDAIAATI